MSSQPALPDTIALLLKILQIVGCWQPEEKSKTTIRAYRLYTVTILSASFVSLFTAQITYIIQVIDNLEKLTDAMFLPLTYVGQTIKVGNFLLMKYRVRRLVNALRKEMFQPKSDLQREMLKKRMTTFKFVYIYFMTMATATIALWAVFPLLEKNSGNAEERKLPVAAWYPFNFTRSPQYEIVYIHQIVAIFINALTNITLDCLTPGFMCFIGVQLEFLNDSLENIKEQTETKLEKIGKLNSSTTNKQCKTTMNEEFFQELNVAQINCISHHCNILKLCTEINSMFSIATVAQLSVSIFTICFTMFQLTLVSPFSIQFWSMVGYQGCMLTELFLFCWYGNEVLLKSAHIVTSTYKSDWADFPIWFKRNVVIIMTRAHRPINMYAGNFFILSLQTFMMILRTSWSYFAVLQKVHSK